MRGFISQVNSAWTQSNQAVGSGGFEIGDLVDGPTCGFGWLINRGDTPSVQPTIGICPEPLLGRKLLPNEVCMVFLFHRPLYILFPKGHHCLVPPIYSSQKDITAWFRKKDFLSSKKVPMFGGHASETEGGHASDTICYHIWGGLIPLSNELTHTVCGRPDTSPNKTVRAKRLVRRESATLGSLGE